MFTDKDPSEKGLRSKVNNYVSQMKVINHDFSLYFNVIFGFYTSIKHAELSGIISSVQHDLPRRICRLKTLQQICKILYVKKRFKSF